MSIFRSRRPPTARRVRVSTIHSLTISTTNQDFTLSHFNDLTSSDIVEPVVDAANNVVENVVEPVIDAANNVAENVVEPVVDAANDVAENVVEPVVEAAKDVVEDVEAR